MKHKLYNISESTFIIDGSVYPSYIVKDHSCISEIVYCRRCVHYDAYDTTWNRTLCIKWKKSKIWHNYNCNQFAYVPDGCGIHAVLQSLDNKESLQLAKSYKDYEIEKLKENIKYTTEKLKNEKTRMKELKEEKL